MVNWVGAGMTKSKHTCRILAVLAAILVLYPLSVGPLAWREWNGYALDSGLYDAAVVAYRPLDLVCENSDAARSVRDDWVRWWTTH